MRTEGKHKINMEAEEGQDGLIHVELICLAEMTCFKTSVTNRNKKCLSPTYRQTGAICVLPTLKCGQLFNRMNYASPWQCNKTANGADTYFKNGDVCTTHSSFSDRYNRCEQNFSPWELERTLNFLNSLISTTTVRVCALLQQLYVLTSFFSHHVALQAVWSSFYHRLFCTQPTQWLSTAHDCHHREVTTLLGCCAVAMCMLDDISKHYSALNSKIKPSQKWTASTVRFDVVCTLHHPTICI